MDIPNVAESVIAIAALGLLAWRFWAKPTFVPDQYRHAVSAMFVLAFLGILGHVVFTITSSQPARNQTSADISEELESDGTYLDESTLFQSTMGFHIMLPAGMTYVEVAEPDYQLIAVVEEGSINITVKASSRKARELASSTTAELARRNPSFKDDAIRDCTDHGFDCVEFNFETSESGVAMFGRARIIKRDETIFFAMLAQRGSNNEAQKNVLENAFDSFSLVGET